MNYTSINSYLRKCIENNYHCQHCAKNHDGTCFFAFECFMDNMKHFDDDNDENCDIPNSADETNYNPCTKSNDYEEANHIFENMIHWCNFKGYSWKIVNKHFFWQTHYQTGEKDENYNVKWHSKEYFTRI